MAAPQNMEGVEDDVVQYYLFTTKPASSFEDQLHTYLAYLSCKYDINKYIWQRDPFRLQFVGTTGTHHVCIDNIHQYFGLCAVFVGIKYSNSC